MLLNAFDLEPERLRQAIVATFARCGTLIHAEAPDGLSEAFASDAGKLQQWNALPAISRVRPLSLGSSSALCG
jgi:hypothetical protein